MNDPSTRGAGPEPTRQRLIEAALRLFGERGYTRSSTRAIAAEAGVNEVTLFRHFGSKKNLLLACVEAFNASGFTATFDRHLSGDYARDIMTMARLQVRDMIERFDLLRLMLCDARAVPEVQETLRAGAQQNAQRLVAYFRRQQEQGIVRSDLDPALLAQAFDSLFSSPAFFRQMLQMGELPAAEQEEAIRQLAAIFVQGTVRRA